MGKPGCGKGTQAKMLSERTGWHIFASGKLFREIAAEDSPVGRKVKQENDIGLLQPHWFAMYLYLKSLFSIPDHESAIFDGFNRKPQEANLIIESMKWLGRPFSVVLVEVSDEEVRKRIALRKETSGRADDAVADERLKEYYAHTAPSIDLFRSAGVLLEVNGEQTPEQVAADVAKILTLA